MKRILALVLLALFVSANAFAANKTATFGDYNSSGVYRLTATDDGVLTFAQDTGIAYPYVATATTNATLTAAQTGSTIIFNNGTGTAANGTTYTLPTATVGLQFTILSNVAKWFRIKPQSGDTLAFSSATAGQKMNNTASAAQGDSIAIFCGIAGTWSIVDKTGTWAVDSNP